jgi:uncharacterized membrane protein
MRKTIAKAVTWRLIGTAEVFAIAFWTTGGTAGHTAGIAAICSFLTYIAHELAWSGEWGEALPTAVARLRLAATRYLSVDVRNLDSFSAATAKARDSLSA